MLTHSRSFKNFPLGEGRLKNFKLMTFFFCSYLQISVRNAIFPIFFNGKGGFSFFSLVLPQRKCQFLCIYLYQSLPKHNNSRDECLTGFLNTSFLKSMKHLSIFNCYTCCRYSLVTSIRHHTSMRSIQ